MTEQSTASTEASGTQTTTPTTTTEVSLDTLIDQTFSSEELNHQGAHKGVDFKSVIEQLPADAKKLVHNLREDYRQKTTTLSQRAKELESREAHLLSNDVAEKLKQAANLPADLDLYDPENLRKYIDAKAAEQLNSLLEPARKEMAKQQRTAQIEDFKKVNPDFDTYKEEMRELISQGTATKVEDAYYLAKGKHTDALLRTEREELDAYRKAAASAGLKVSTGRSSGNATPKFTSAVEAFEYYKANGKL